MGMVNTDQKRVTLTAILSVVHENYNSNGKNNNDIALLMLNEDAQLGGKLLNYNLQNTLTWATLFRRH
jgi:Trypsin